MVGSHLAPHLETQGHQVTGLPRAADPNVVPRWQPTENEFVLPQPNPFEAVVHLAGHPIACRWTASNKHKIRASRVEGTRLLARELARTEPRPRVLICASATGYYGDRGDEWLEENSAPGKGFLAEVAQEWEQATRGAEEAGIRVAHLRFGIILSSYGGALAKMLPVFRLGLGGRVGDGSQYWSWISLPDLLTVITHALGDSNLAGPVNAVSPHPATNREFTAALGKALHRPTVLPLPKVAARLALGEMADEALLASTRVRPRRLLETGFQWDHPDLATALAGTVQSITSGKAGGLKL